MRRGRVGIVNAERQLAKTHCPQKHPYSGDNLGIRANGNRYCRTCMREAARLRRKK